MLNVKCFLLLAFCLLTRWSVAEYYDAFWDMTDKEKLAWCEKLIDKSKELSCVKDVGLYPKKGMKGIEHNGWIERFATTTIYVVTAPRESDEKSKCIQEVSNLAWEMGARAQSGAQGNKDAPELAALIFTKIHVLSPEQEKIKSEVEKIHGVHKVTDHYDKKLLQVSLAHTSLSGIQVGRDIEKQVKDALVVDWIPGVAFPGTTALGLLVVGVRGKDTDDGFHSYWDAPPPVPNMKEFADHIKTNVSKAKSCRMTVSGSAVSLHCDGLDLSMSLILEGGVTDRASYTTALLIENGFKIVSTVQPVGGPVTYFFSK